MGVGWLQIRPSPDGNVHYCGVPLSQLAQPHVPSPSLRWSPHPAVDVAQCLQQRRDHHARRPVLVELAARHKVCVQVTPINKLLHHVHRSVVLEHLVQLSDVGVRQAAVDLNLAVQLCPVRTGEEGAGDGGEG